MSTPLIDCYNYVVGLYRGECDCFEGRPDDYDASDSDLYICDLLEPEFINGLLNCGQGASIWDLLEIVRKLAIHNFIGDTNAIMLKWNQLRRVPYYGAIGRVNFNRDKPMTTGYYAGVRMFCADVVSGYMKVKSIGTIFNTTGTITLWLYNGDGELLETFTLPTVANRHKVTTLPTPLVLELHDKYKSNVDYYWLYQVTFNPKNNDLSCNCKGWSPSFDTRNPYYTRSNKFNGWADYLMAGGFYGASLPNWLTPQATALNDMNGLTFDVELGCRVGEVFCKDGLDYDANTLAQAMALAIQNKSAALFIDKILSTTNLNYDVMVARDERLRERGEYLNTYNEMVNYIAENVDITQNDCYQCRDVYELLKVGIKA
jgi:hypothetical protein